MCSHQLYEENVSRRKIRINEAKTAEIIHSPQAPILTSQVAILNLLDHFFHADDTNPYLLLSLILPLQSFKRPQSVFTFCLEFYPLFLPPKSFNIHWGISRHPWIVLLPQPFSNTFYSFVLPTQVCHFLFTLLVGKL